MPTAPGTKPCAASAAWAVAPAPVAGSVVSPVASSTLTVTLLGGTVTLTSPSVGEGTGSAGGGSCPVRMTASNRSRVAVPSSTTAAVALPVAR